MPEFQLTPGSAVEGVAFVRRRRRRFAIGAAAVCLLLGGAALGFSQSTSPAPGPGAPASPTIPEPSTVRLRITGFPASAKLYLDGRLLPSNPANHELPRDARTHDLRVEADGHRSERRVFALNEDSDLVVALEPIPAPERAAPAPAVPKTEVAPSSDCAPAYIVDAEGVTRFKPSCL